MPLPFPLHLFLLPPLSYLLPSLPLSSSSVASPVSTSSPPSFYHFFSNYINASAYFSENRTLFALNMTSFAASSSLSFTSNGLILYSSLFPSLINCFCSMFSISITSNIFLQASLSSLCLSFICSSSDYGRLYTTTFFFLPTFSVLALIFSSILASVSFSF